MKKKNLLFIIKYYQRAEKRKTSVKLYPGGKWLIKRPRKVEDEADSKLN